MGIICKPPYVKFIIGFLWQDDLLLEKCKKKLTEHFGEIDFESSAIDFTFTNYYNGEIGDKIKRQYVSFSKLIEPGDINAIKVFTNDIEQKFAKGEKRPVNIDPGYVDLSKLVLASTKDATYRIYAKDGMYLQSTLYFEGKTFKPWPLTYADYRSNHAIEFFTLVRNHYKNNEYNNKDAKKKRVGYTDIFYRPWFIALAALLLLFPLMIVPVKRSLALGKTSKIIFWLLGSLWSITAYYAIIIFFVKFGDLLQRLFYSAMNQ